MSLLRSSVLATAFVCLLLVNVGDTEAQTQITPAFVEVTEAVGLGTTESDKTSSPSVGDLDGNGRMDIVMCNHARGPFEVFMNFESGFTRSEIFPTKADKHGTGIGDYNSDGRPDIILAVGGGSSVTLPSQPVIGETEANGTITRVEASERGLDGRKVRGVGIRFVDLDGDGDLDVFIHGRKRPLVDTSRRHAVYENVGGGQYLLRKSEIIEYGPSGVGFLCTDYNNDGIPDFLIYSSGIEVFKGLGDFQFQNATDEFFPDGVKGRFTGAAELDYDNDGDMDLFFAGGYRDKGPWIRGPNRLFENKGHGVFEDVMSAASTGRGAHPGATVGDFNNDGWIDIFLPNAGPGDQRLPESDIILLNNGDKTFSNITTHGANGPTEPGWAAGAQAFDYNNDGLLDVVVGSRLPSTTTSEIRGRMRLFENQTPGAGNFVVIRVPVMTDDLKETTMDAEVRIKLGNNKFLVKKCGSVGDHRAHSFINDVHFGLGSVSKVKRIEITLSTGRAFFRKMPKNKRDVNQMRWINFSVFTEVPRTNSPVPTPTLPPTLAPTIAPASPTPTPSPTPTASPPPAIEGGR